MSALDWFGRVALLVLSGLSTFAVILALQTASEGMSGPRRDDVATTPVDMPPPREQAVSPSPLEVTKTSSGPEGVTGVGKPDRVPVDTPPPAEEGMAQWLKALTYAVLALAGFSAACLLVLLRITAHLSRIADRDRN